jgi:Zn-dependent protease with chaperone function
VLSEGLNSLLTAAELEVVVGHEIAHVRSRHGRVLRLLSAVEHPMPSLDRITGAVRIAMERAADETAIRRNQDRRMALLDALLKMSGSETPELVAAFTHKSGIVERASALLDSPPAPTRSHRVAAALTVGAAPLAGAVVIGAWAVTARACFS